MTYYETNTYGQSQYVGFVPVEYDRIIINNGSAQTVDTPISGHVGLWADAQDPESGKWSVGTWTITINTGENPTEPGGEDPTNPPQPSGTLLGDTDGDSKVDVFDASYIQKGLAGTLDYPPYPTMTSDDPLLKIADIDGDGKVDIFDASLIQKYIAGDLSAQSYGIGQPMAS